MMENLSGLVGHKPRLVRFLKKFDWDNALALAHNTQFDGAILNWHFGIKPKGYLDTLCMARAIHGVDAGGSLKALAERYRDWGERAMRLSCRG